MRNMRHAKLLVLMLMLLALFAGCKGESSPTAPNPGGGTGGSGGTTPPTGAVVTLTVSAANPTVDSSSIITATVTQNNQPVPNGTAVEFTTTFGTFFETGTKTAVRTTTNGVATITLTSSTAGPATIQAVVNNILKTTVVTFQAKSIDTGGCPPTCPPAAPTITSITPNFGNPSGGQIVTITGTNFKAPVRVFFDFGAGTSPVEATVASRTDTQLQVVTPAVNLGNGQSKPATIIVITQAGTTSEQRVSSPTFNYQVEVLTPTITSLSPASGPIDGGTRVTIFGDAFQSPVQVFFGSAEAQVVTIGFKQLIVISPTARDTAPNGSGTVTGPVNIRVVNLASAKEATLAAGFRYTPKMQITAAGPTQARFDVPTQVTIDGIGFNDPVAVAIAGFVAQPIKVTGTQLLVIAEPIQPPSCADVSGPISVVNVDNGDNASFPLFIYRVPKPVITNVTSSTGGLITLGSGLSITVSNPSTLPQLTVRDINVPITSAASNGNGTTTFTTIVPPQLQLSTQACPAGGSIPIPTAFNVTFTSGFTTCTVTLTNGVTIVPVVIGKLFTNPNPLTLQASAGNPAATPPTPPVDADGTFAIVNNGAGPLTITSVTGGNANISITPPPPGTVLQPCESISVGVHYQHQANGQSSTAVISIQATSSGQNLSASETVTGTTGP
jgi:hypothetical protein